MRSISIVGHGIGCKEYGTLIDASDIVIRLADCHWQNKRDHGRKYMIGVLRDSSSYWRFLDKAKRIRKPDLCYWLYHDDDEREYTDFYRGCLVIPIMRRYLNRLLGGNYKPTRGTAAILQAMNVYSNYDAIYLFGFDGIFEDKFRHHPNCYTKKSIKKNKSHDLLYERDMIIKASQDYNFRLYHYQRRINQKRLSTSEFEVAHE